MNGRTARRAFTLIELLVVISIISILASMLFPSFAKARGKARAIDCVSNLSQLGKAFMMYNSDYDGLNPPHDFSNFVSTFQRAGHVVDDWSAPTSGSNWAKSIYTYVKAYPVYICKSNIGWAPGSNTAIPGLSYMMNGWLTAKLQDAAPNPSGVCLLYDWKFEASWAACNPGTSFSLHWGWAPHEERFNVLYCDGHVKGLPETVWAQNILPPGPPDGVFYF